MQTSDIVLTADRLSQRFGDKTALTAFSLSVAAGQIHALLGPNGAGKTTALRVIAGLLEPTSGTVRIFGRESTALGRGKRGIALIPSGDRTFYLRLTGLENLVFFARLHGLSRAQAVKRAELLLDDLGLGGDARRAVGAYSHGMQKRLSVARALITRPALLLVDEATHDLDPEGARHVRDLIGAIAEQGTAVVWATQRLDEIRGFAEDVTVLKDGRDVFAGPVPELIGMAVPRTFVLRLRDGHRPQPALLSALKSAIGAVGSIESLGDEDSESFLLRLDGDAILGEALERLAAARVELLACREERSALEDAFLLLTRRSETTP